LKTQKFSVYFFLPENPGNNIELDCMYKLWNDLDEILYMQSISDTEKVREHL